MLELSLRGRPFDARPDMSLSHFAIRDLLIIDRRPDGRPGDDGSNLATVTQLRRASAKVSPIGSSRILIYKEVGGKMSVDNVQWLNGYNAEWAQAVRFAPASFLSWRRTWNCFSQ